MRAEINEYLRLVDRHDALDDIVRPELTGRLDTTFPTDRATSDQVDADRFGRPVRFGIEKKEVPGEPNGTPGT